MSSTNNSPLIPDTPENRAFVENLRKLQSQISDILIRAEFAHAVECVKCGCRRVQFAHWVEVNSGRIDDQFGSWNERDARWCPDCGEHTDLADVGYDVEDTRPLAAVHAD